MRSALLQLFKITEVAHDLRKTDVIEVIMQELIYIRDYVENSFRVKTVFAQHLYILRLCILDWGCDFATRYLGF